MLTSQLCVEYITRGLKEREGKGGKGGEGEEECGVWVGVLKKNKGGGGEW